MRALASPIASSLLAGRTGSAAVVSMARRRRQGTGNASRSPSATDIFRPTRLLLLGAAAKQAASFASVGWLLIVLLRVADPQNPKTAPLAQWPSGAASSLAIVVGLLTTIVAFNVAVALGTTGHSPPKLAEQATASDLLPLPKLTPGERDASTAWLTVLLAIGSTGAYTAVAWLGASGRTHPAVAVLLCTVAIFGSFTPMHDAVHGAVSPKHRWLNDVMGLIASAPFVFNFRAFKLIHLSHHRYCNRDSSLDPDAWSGEGSQLLLPLRWASVFLWYNAFATRKSVEPDTAARWAAAWWEMCLVPPIFAVGLWWRFEREFVVYWLLPFSLATTWLMYVFDYIPHRPHVVPHSVDPYRATSMTAYLHPSLPEGHLSFPLLFQNYHNIHHLWPFLPFYKYAGVWDRLKGDLRARGTQELPFLG